MIKVVACGCARVVDWKQLRSVCVTHTQLFVISIIRYILKPKSFVDQWDCSTQKYSFIVKQ